MPPQFGWLILGALLAGCQSFPNRASIERHGFDRAKLYEIETEFQKQVDGGRLPGAAIRISRDDDILYDVVLGFADLDSKKPLQRDALFRIYSMTKPILAVAALQQMEQGLYALDTPIAEFLPEFAHPTVLADPDAGSPETIPAAKAITVRHLLTHTAGFSYEHSALLDDASSLDDFVSDLAAMPLRNQPGAAFAYGLESDLLGALIERAARVPLERVLRERIFAPLGMDDTGFCVPQDQLARLGVLYAYGVRPVLEPKGGAEEVDRWRCPVRAPSGGGGLISTVEDYWRFAQALRQGGALDTVRILTRDSVALLATAQTGVDESATSWWMGGTDWGLSVAVVTDASANEWLDVNGNYYWSGAASTYFWIDPHNDLICVFMTQVLRGDHPNTFKEDIRNLVYRAFVDPAVSAE